MGVNLIQKIRYLAKRHPLLYRVRYALITEVDGLDFAAAPSAYELSSESGIPPEFLAAVSRVDLAGDGGFDDALTLAYDLSRGHRRGPGLSRASTGALKHIYSGERGGVCSDYTQVFLGLCAAARVPAREWGLCANFEGHGIGHSVAEVYSSGHGKWIFLDPLFSIFAVRRGDSTPLAVTEMVDLVTAGRAREIELELIDSQGKPGQKRDRYVDRYFRPSHAFFLLTKNDVFGQDVFLRWSGAVPPPILHMIMFLTRRYQRFHVYTNHWNRREMTRRVTALRSFLRRGLAAAVMGLLAAAGGIALALKR